jgi:hypothetical protein
VQHKTSSTSGTPAVALWSSCSLGYGVPLKLPTRSPSLTIVGVSPEYGDSFVLSASALREAFLTTPAFLPLPNRSVQKRKTQFENV